eukprot:4379820-Pleurochrysis_carterae.AAC.1
MPAYMELIRVHRQTVFQQTAAHTVHAPRARAAGAQSTRVRDTHGFTNSECGTGWKVRPTKNASAANLNPLHTDISCPRSTKIEELNLRSLHKQSPAHPCLVKERYSLQAQDKNAHDVVENTQTKRFQNALPPLTQYTDALIRARLIQPSSEEMVFLRMNSMLKTGEECPTRNPDFSARETPISDQGKSRLYCTWRAL